MVIPVGGLWLYRWEVCDITRGPFVVMPLGGLRLYPWEICGYTSRKFVGVPVGVFRLPVAGLCLFLHILAARIVTSWDTQDASLGH